MAQSSSNNKNCVAASGTTSLPGFQRGSIERALTPDQLGSAAGMNYVRRIHGTNRRLRFGQQLETAGGTMSGRGSDDKIRFLRDLLDADAQAFGRRRDRGRLGFQPESRGNRNIE